LSVTFGDVQASHADTNAPSGQFVMTVLRVIAGVGALPFTGYALRLLLAQIRYGFDPLGAILGSAVAMPAIICWWFALQGHRAESRARLGYALGGGLILGGVSLAAGFVGPLILNPGANQGPLLGIFFTGPIGFVVGVGLGAVYARFRVRRAGRITAQLLLAGCCVAVVGFVYVASQPDDRRVGELVDGTVIACAAPAELADEVLKEWEKRISMNPQTAASSWREDVVRTLKASDGYLATFSVQRKRDLYIGRKRSNYGSTYAAPWRENKETIRYFVSRDLCATGEKAKPGRPACVASGRPLSPRRCIQALLADEDAEARAAKLCCLGFGEKLA
jgi:hypothetical protein